MMDIIQRTLTHRMRMVAGTSCVFVLLFTPAARSGELRLHHFYTDHMVLQRDKPVQVDGWAAVGAEVTVSFAGQRKAATADENGKWAVILDPMPANAQGGALRCQVSGGRGDEGAVALSNVLVGDVWFFGRQTYVDISLGRTDAGQAAAAKYKPDGNFRAMVIKTIPAKTPQDDLDKTATSGWLPVDGKNALGMSGAAFYLGRDLVPELGVPVGIVDVDMGPYFGIGWMSRKALADSVILHPDDKEIDWLPGFMEVQGEERDSGKAQQELDAYFAEMVKKRPDAEKPSLGLHPLKNPMYPSAGYNAVINPLKGVALRGVLLQLGNDYPFIAYRELEKQGTSTVKAELDAAWGENYTILKSGYRVTPATLPYVPGDWRRAFGDQQLPFGLVLPPGSDLDVYAAHNREIREMHRRTAEVAEGIGLIMPGTENIPFSGQPVDDALFAERCRHWVLGAVSGSKEVAATGPLFDRAEARLSKATVYFKDGTADGLKAVGDALDHFETAGPDRQFAPATASIDGSTVKLKSDSPIQFARYNWTEKPVQGLVNRDGLPALPFSNDPDWEFAWVPPDEKPELPEEYSTTADKWGKSDVAIVNGQIEGLASGDSEPIPRRPGPIGIYSSPFGPNIYVISIDPGTPADGKVMPGDVIYGVNGKAFEDAPGVPEDQPYRALSEAITYSESEEGAGRLVLSLRRGTRTLDVALALEVLGSYSSTTPYYCEKSQNIVRNAEAWLAKQYRPESGLASAPVGMLNTDLLFLLASGTSEHQGLVRRAIYSKIRGMDPLQYPDPNAGAHNWGLGYTSLLLGEYYHATGDRNVLPYLKNQVDWAAMTQIKPPTEPPSPWEWARSEDQVGGWRQRYHSVDQGSTYGLMPHAGMSCVMGMLLAKEAGLAVDELALERGLTHFNKGRAEYAFVLYWYDNLRKDGPAPIHPEAEVNGMMGSMNGKLGTAAALYNMVDYNDTVEICSRYCVYSFNNTRHGHGGMFFNNFWTPIGAWAAGENGYKHFMKNQAWWRELFRRHDGSFNQVGRGGIGVGYALPYVAPKQRLRILGAPKSAFGPNLPDYLKPAAEAHTKRDYALCEGLILKQLSEHITPAEDMPVIDHLLESVRILRASIAHDLDLTETLIEEGKYYYAALEVPQLKGVVAADNPRLKAIVETLESPEGSAKVDAHRRVCAAQTKNEAVQGAAPSPAKENWIDLIAEESVKQVGDKWRIKLVEHISQAPDDWTEPAYDDGAWNETSLPASWCVYHTALFRSTFHVEDKGAIEALRVQGRFFQQANVVVYLNGKLVAKIDNLERGTGTTDARLTDYAMGLLQKGENTIAVSSRHKRRWGSYRGTYKTAETVGFSVQAKQRD